MVVERNSLLAAGFFSKGHLGARPSLDECLVISGKKARRAVSRPILL